MVYGIELCCIHAVETVELIWEDLAFTYKTTAS
jgi:hypothetical protein